MSRAPRGGALLGGSCGFAVQVLPVRVLVRKGAAHRRARLLQLERAPASSGACERENRRLERQGEAGATTPADNADSRGAARISFDGDLRARTAHPKLLFTVVCRPYSPAPEESEPRGGLAVLGARPECSVCRGPAASLSPPLPSAGCRSGGRWAPRPFDEVALAQVELCPARSGGTARCSAGRLPCA